MVIIYKITNPKGLIYIGQTVNLKRRLNEYKSKSFSRQVKLYNSISKYGISNHNIDVIAECSYENANEIEYYFQEFYNSVEKGLNCIYVNTKVSKTKVSKETREKMSEAAKKRDNSKRSFYPRNRVYTKGVFKHSEKTKNKISIAAKNRSKPNRVKEVLNTDTGEVFCSLKKLCDLKGFNYSTMKSRLQGRVKNNTKYIYK